MSFYRDLQLDTAVLKERIRSGAASRQQVYYGTVLTAKAVLTLLFCTAVSYTHLTLPTTPSV